MYVRVKRLVRYAALSISVAAALMLISIFSLQYRTPSWTTGMVAAGYNGHAVNYEFRSIESLPVSLSFAAVMTEDGRFCRHYGVDWLAIYREVKKIGTGRKIYGASTISMQTARSVYLWQGRSFVRKVLEIPIAIAMDSLLTKRRMMEIYLNIVEFGPGIYGVEAASQHYFDKSAKYLSEFEAALLITTLPRPKDWRPNRPTRKHRRNAQRTKGYLKAANRYVECLKTPEQLAHDLILAEQND